ncbi:hypothetical protein ACHQM5_011317 [Ranunculus cassubicifolius]
MVLSCVSSLQLPPPLAAATHNKNNTPIEYAKLDLLNKFKTPLELKQVHSHLIKTNNINNLPLDRVGPICALSKHHDDFNYARSLFQRLSSSDEIFLWNTCLRTLAEGDGDSPFHALLVFSHLRKANILPDTFTCSFVLKASSILSHFPIGVVVHALVVKLGFQHDLFLQNTILNMYTSCCSSPTVPRHFFDKMPQRDVVSWNIMITYMTKQGDIRAAHDLFDEMPKRSVRSWTAMIAGYVQCGNPKEAISLFTQMEQAKAEPNEVTVVAVLAACADLGALDLGRRIHHYLCKCGFGGNIRVCNTLIDMYIKCGCLDIARQVFDDMEKRTVVSWSAMIGGLAIHGQAEEALKLFSKMSTIGIKPNAITFIGILHACSHMGLIDEGRRFFGSMTRDYGIIPQIEHYGCMVDLLSRAGLLEEAHEFINNMPIKANSVVWGALLGGCKVHKNVELAEEAIRHLLVLDPMNDGYYIVLSNIYAEAGRWEDTAKVRKMMRDQGVKKTPGWSSIAVDGLVHEFVAGDATHPQTEEIYNKWHKLVEKMKLRGYVPDTRVVLLDMDEEEKVQVVYRHSEKLAVVFGLINTPTGTPIRIMKNLRVCEDCHAALKLISEIVKREIVVRDRNRFHCFKDGSCSCKDYW